MNQGLGAFVDYEEVEEGIHPTATYASFARRIRTLPWGIEETRRFYQVDTSCFKLIFNCFSCREFVNVGQIFQCSRPYFRDVPEGN